MTKYKITSDCVGLENGFLIKDEKGLKEFYAWEIDEMILNNLGDITTYKYYSNLKNLVLKGFYNVKCIIDDLKELDYKIEEIKAFNLQTFTQELENGDLFALDYLEPFIPKHLVDLYDTVCDYNFLYCNGCSINELLTESYLQDYTIEIIKRNDLTIQAIKDKNINDYYELRTKLFKELDFIIQ